MRRRIAGSQNILKRAIDDILSIINRYILRYCANLILGLNSLRVMLLQSYFAVRIANAIINYGE